jgi:WD40 repeat protein
MTVPVPGRLWPRLVLLAAAGTAVMGVLAAAVVVAAVVVLAPAPRHQAAAHPEPTYQRLLYRQVCGKLDTSSLAAGFGTVDPEAITGDQDATGFGCQLLGSPSSGGVNTIDVRVSYFDSPARARAAVTTAYPKLAKAKDVSRLQHVKAGDAAFAFLCAGGASSDGCDAANRAAAAFPATDRPDNYALAAAASRNARITVAAQQEGGTFDTSTGPAALTAVTAFVQRNLPLLATAAATPVFLAGHQDNVDSLAFNPSGTLLASGDAGGTVRVWNVATHRAVDTLASPDGATGIVFAVAFSPDGKTLATGRSDGTILLWDVATGHLTATLSSDYTLIESLSFSPDGRTLASGGDIGMGGAVRLWDVAHGTLTRTFGHDITNSVAFSPDGTTLASGGGGGLRLWNVATGQATTLLPDTGSYFSLAYSRDGRTLAVGSDYAHNIRLFDTATRQVTATLTDGTDGPFHSVSFSPDGKTVASKSNRNGIELWDVATGHVTTTYPGDGPVTFASNGTTLASTLNDHYVLLWPLR